MDAKNNKTKYIPLLLPKKIPLSRQIANKLILKFENLTKSEFNINGIKMNP
jgi:hypothetical protein